MPDPDSKEPPDSGGSGSVEVQLSNPKLDAAAPESVPRDDSAPVSSGRVQAVEANEGTGPAKRSKRLSVAIQNTVSGGVEKLGGAIETLGGGVEKLGEVTKKVPLVGPTVAALGEGLAKAGDTIALFPERARQSRRVRLLARSVIVGLLVVAAWIAAIVAWQLRTTDVPDFRADAEQVLAQIGKGSAAIEQLYDNASPRFAEVVQKERFVEDMTDMNATFGKFKEITAINDTTVTTGPTGRLGRVSLTAAYERGIVKGNIIFHWDQGKWKLFLISMEVPPELVISQAEREQRVAACLDDKGHDISKDMSPDSRKKCPVRDAAETILEQLRDGKPGEVWDAARDVFKTQEPREKFVEIQQDHRAALGKYLRIVDVTEAHQVKSTARVRGQLVALESATFDVVAEFERSSGVRVVFGFEREKKTDPWQLRSFKLVVPMPRAEEATAPAPEAPPPPPKLTAPPPKLAVPPPKPKKK